MSEHLTGLMARIFIGGVICSLAMILAGDGAKKEIVRLCCTCLMVVFILSPVKGANFSVSELLGQRESVENEINRGLADAMQQEAAQIALAIEAHIAAKGQSLGLECEVQVVYAVGVENQFDIIKIVVKTSQGDVPGEFIRVVADDCGISAEKIIVQKGERP